MSRNKRENEDRSVAAAILAWENEGGAVGRENADPYGRRIEPDRSWTIYHVFTGIPADVGGRTMTGLSKLEATDGMISFNLRNQARRKIGTKAPSMWLSTLDAIKSWW